MKKRDRCIILTIALLFAMLTIGSTPVPADRSLYHLKRLGVTVRISDRVRVAANVNEEAIRRRVEASLIRAGIGVLSPAASKKEPGRPRLLVEVIDISMVLLPGSDKRLKTDLLIEVSLLLYQDVTLVRVKNPPLEAITWSSMPKHSVFWGGSFSKEARVAILEDVDSGVRAFVQSHRAGVNE